MESFVYLLRFPESFFAIFKILLGDNGILVVNILSKTLSNKYIILTYVATLFISKNFQFPAALTFDQSCKNHGFFKFLNRVISTLFNSMFDTYQTIIYGKFLRDPVKLICILRQLFIAEKLWFTRIVVVEVTFKSVSDC